MYAKQWNSGVLVLAVATLLWASFSMPASAQEATTTPQPASGALLRDGVFGCNASKYANIGTITAVGGVYVPVNDAAVTINTGYLVYKECVLDGVTAKISEAARTELAGSILRLTNTGRSGKPLYEVNALQEKIDTRDKTVLALFKGGALNNVSPDVQKAVLRNYMTGTRKPESVLSCPPTTGNFWNDFMRYSNPQCNPIGAFSRTREFVDIAQGEALEDRENQLLRSGGFYPVTDNNENPLEQKILTPGYIVAQGIGQSITSGFRCLEGADELSEVCAPLFTGLTTQLLGDTRGLSGITQAQSGAPSYVSRMTQEASSAVRQEAVNAALSILSVARQSEALFKQAKEATANILVGAINRLRTAERRCWELIIENVCTTVPTGTNKTCTAKGDGNFQLEIATSTQFSQAVINQRIIPLATPIADDIKKSDQALSELNLLIANVTNSASAANQRQALERLDTMVANNMLHNGEDAKRAQTQTDTVTGEMNTLIETTLTTWGDNTDPNVGWCNVNSPTLIQAWITRWKK